MKHTKQEIKEKSQLIMKDLDGKFYFEDCINNIHYHKDNIVFAGKLKGKNHPVWSISIKAPFENLDFLHISDETGEPLFYQNFNTKVFEIEKDEKGYFRVGLPRI